ncbi:MAG: DUF3370 family protein, partial [Leptolyngbya sp. SIO4C1]|nr:DUF3370 family protein [Leptolyngbya sp. SIO4C1]
MLSYLLALHFTQAHLLAQTAPSATPAEPEIVVRPQTVRSLPGALDQVPVFNSNSPELIGTPGILLSTFPSAGKAVPEAHLDFAFSQRFDIFAHHVYRAEDPDDLRSMYLSILVHNPSSTPVALEVLAGASYLSQPDAPFIELPAAVSFSPLAPIFAGPGSRAMGDLLQGRRQAIFPPTLTLAPGQSHLLLNQPIPVETLDPPINGRSTLIRLHSSGPVYVASLAQYAATESAAPTLEQWQTLLETAGLATPRDKVPTPIEAMPRQVIYGRVAGVSAGSSWTTAVTRSLATLVVCG